MKLLLPLFIGFAYGFTTQATITRRDDTCTRCTVQKSVQQCQKENVCKQGDIGASSGKTQCGLSATSQNVVGVDPTLLSKTGQPVPPGQKGSNTRCGQSITIRANGRSVVGLIADRVAPGSGTTRGRQVDLSPTLAAKLGFKGNIVGTVEIAGP